MPSTTRTAHRRTPTDALEEAADLARLAPSVHNTQPWRLVLRPDRLDLRAERTRQLLSLDPLGRELGQSVGAALLNARVALAAAGWAVHVQRWPDLADPDLVAVVRPVEGPADAALAALAPYARDRHTNRRPFTGETVPDELLDAFAAAVAAEGAELVPVRAARHRELVARLTRQADALQNADPAYRAELRHWTTRTPGQGDGVPAVVVPHVPGRRHDDLPIRDFDVAGAGALPAQTHSTAEQTVVLLATPRDDQRAWLHAGEALERLLLVLTRDHWVASPLTQAVEVPLTRTRLRAALAWHGHPQSLLRIGRAESTAGTPRRPRQDVVDNSTRPPPPPPPVRSERPPRDRERRPVPDGRGGTTWR
ncbi:Acg family FMN-binding oxidoreductase [Blastococcus sp. SYSU D00695]